MKPVISKPRHAIMVMILVLTLFSLSNAAAQDKNQVVRIAKLQIDPAQLENYKTALKEHAETAVRVEPGVITLYAVAEKNNPTHITVFEIYANAEAYQAHLQTAHFKKYKSTTKDMVKSLELVDVEPIALETKMKQ
ncbi:putative quinol monooxygenase [Mucilaginibacter sp. RCC_168]|jgi:quinol monooxygenase YgiN|uniref:putative quinol monooxygenase n=1 Tax=Mucilaginibacter sp. RCC_168 TaxID=3239221 RepID=UPI003524E313